MLERKYFVAGSDSFRVDQKGKEIYERFRDFDCEIVDGTALKIADAIQKIRFILEGLRTVPMFGSQKFIWFRYVNFLNDSVVGRSEDVLSAMQELQQVVENNCETCFLLTAAPVDKRLKIVKWFISNLDSEIFDEAKNSAYASYAKKKALTAGVEFDGEALDLFLQRCGPNTAVIDGELEKLLLYVYGRGRIVRDDVDSLIADISESSFFEPIDWFFKKNDEKFLVSLKKYFLTYSEGRPLLSALQNRTRLLIQLRYLIDQGAFQSRTITQAKLEEVFSSYQSIYNGQKSGVFSQNPWYLSNLLQVAKEMSLEALLRLQMRLFNAVLGLVGSGKQQQSFLERLYFENKISELYA